MSTVAAHIEALRRRDRRVRAIDRFLEAAFGLSLAVAGLLLVDRLLFEFAVRPTPLATPVTVIGAFASVFAISAVAALAAARRGADLRLLAWRADKALGSDERVLTSLEMGSTGAFADTLSREAAQSLESIRPDQVVPSMPVGYRAGIALSLAAAAALLALPPIFIDPPAADFMADVERGLAPLDVSFESLTTGRVSSLDWDFGDGARAKGPVVVQRYTRPGRYTVTLVARGPGGRGEKSAPGLIEVLDPTQPLAAFEVDPPKGRAPLAVTFRNLCRNATGWAWDFGDGSKSTEASPVHVYVNPGRYAVQLMATNPAGRDVAVKREAVRVIGPDAPLADFRGIPKKGPPPLEVQFEDMGSGPTTSWTWDFGDRNVPSENTSTVRHPFHVYRFPGKYTVKLHVEGPGGQDDAVRERYIEVEDDGSGGGGGGGAAAASPRPSPKPFSGPPPKDHRGGGDQVGRLFDDPQERPVVKLSPEGVPLDGSGELVEKIRNVPMPGPDGAGGPERPYTEVFAEYRRSAEETMRRDRIPPSLRDYVKKYFDQVRPR